MTKDELVELFDRRFPINNNHREFMLNEEFITLLVGKEEDCVIDMLQAAEYFLTASEEKIDPENVKKEMSVMLQSQNPNQMKVMIAVATSKKVLETRTAEEQVGFLQKMLQSDDKHKLMVMGHIAATTQVLENRTYGNQLDLMDLALQSGHDDQLRVVGYIATNEEVLKSTTAEEQLLMIQNEIAKQENKKSR